MSAKRWNDELKQWADLQDAAGHFTLQRGITFALKWLAIWWSGLWWALSLEKSQFPQSQCQGGKDEQTNQNGGQDEPPWNGLTTIKTSNVDARGNGTNFRLQQTSTNIVRQCRYHCNHFGWNLELFQVDQLNVLFPETGTNSENDWLVCFEVLNAAFDSSAIRWATGLRGE